MHITVSLKNGVVIFKPHGRITGNANKSFKKSVYDKLPKSGSPPKMVFDFARVAQMDSMGLGTMMEVGLTVKQKGGRIGVINVSSHIKNLLVISHLISHFEHFPNEDEAVIAFSYSS